MPEAVAVGDTVTLSCDYDLESAALYSVRWYFDADEFYRYVATENPPGVGFPSNELDVDVSWQFWIKSIMPTQLNLSLLLLIF